MSAPSFADVAAAHRTLAAFYEAQARAASNDNRPAEWIAQADSPAGRRRHINECRRLVAQGSDHARIVGRRYLLTGAALDALLGNVTAKRVGASASTAPVVDELAALRARLEKGRAA